MKEKLLEEPKASMMGIWLADPKLDNLWGSLMDLLKGRLMDSWMD
jgi:hypothetical protein